MTNRDRLARMSNAELAEEIKSWESDTCMCPAENVCLRKLGVCVDIILGWLNMETEEDGEKTAC